MRETQFSSPNPGLRKEMAELGFGAADLYQASRIRNPVISAGVFDTTAAGARDQITLGIVASFTDLLTLRRRTEYAEVDFALLQQQIAQYALNVARQTRVAFLAYAAALETYDAAWRDSDIGKDLKKVRNTKPLWSKFGTPFGIILGGIDMWCTTLFGGWSPFGTMSHGKADHEALEPASNHEPIEYPKADGELTFDRLSSVFLSNKYLSKVSKLALKQHSKSLL